MDATLLGHFSRLGAFRQTLQAPSAADPLGIGMANAESALAIMHVYVGWPRRPGCSLWKRAGWRSVGPSEMPVLRAMPAGRWARSARRGLDATPQCCSGQPRGAAMRYALLCLDVRARRDCQAGWPAPLESLKVGQQAQGDVVGSVGDHRCSRIGTTAQEP